MAHKNLNSLTDDVKQILIVRKSQSDIRDSYCCDLWASKGFSQAFDSLSLSLSAINFSGLNNDEPDRVKAEREREKPSSANKNNYTYTSTSVILLAAFKG